MNLRQLCELVSIENERLDMISKIASDLSDEKINVRARKSMLQSIDSVSQRQICIAKAVSQREKVHSLNKYLGKILLKLPNPRWGLELYFHYIRNEKILWISKKLGLSFRAVYRDIAAAFAWTDTHKDVVDDDVEKETVQNRKIAGGGGV